MLIAVSELEHGRLSNARRAIKLLLNDAPNASIRPLAAYYDRVLTGAEISAFPPAPDSKEPQEYLDNGAIASPETAAPGAEVSADSPPPPPVASPLE
jgi:hypothetical protein